MPHVAIIGLYTDQGGALANFSEATLLRVGRLLNPGKSGGHLTRLAHCMGTTRKNIRNWSAEPEDSQFRAMSGTAKRVVSVLAYFAVAGQLSEERMAEIIALEEAMSNDERFERLTAQITKLIEKEAHDAEAEE